MITPTTPNLETAMPLPDIDTILAKPGRNWTPEESKAIRIFIKENGRHALKQRRTEIRDQHNARD